MKTFRSTADPSRVSESSKGLRVSCGLEPKSWVFYSELQSRPRDWTQLYLEDFSRFLLPFGFCIDRDRSYLKSVTIGLHMSHLN